MTLNVVATLGVPWDGANEDCALTSAGRLR